MLKRWCPYFIYKIFSAIMIAIPMSLPIVLLIILTIVNVILVIVILRKSYRNPINLSYAFFVGGVSLWAATNAFFQITSSKFFAFWLANASYLSAVDMALSLFYLSLYFPKKITYVSTIGKKINALLIVSTIIVTFAILIPNFILIDVIISDGSRKLVTGTGLLLYAVYILCLVVLSFKNFIHNYHSSFGIPKAQLKFVILGLVGLVFFAVLFNLILPILGIYNLVAIGPNSAIFLICCFAYAIAKYRLLNIKFVITRSIIYLFLISIISSSFILASSIAAVFFQNLGVNLFIVWVAFAFVVVLGFDPLKNLFASVTDKIFYKEKIDYGVVLKNLSNYINEELELNSLVLHIQDALATQIKVRKSELLLSVFGEQIFLPLDEYMSFTPRKRNKKTAKQDNQIYYDSSFIKYLRKEQEIIVTDEFERYIYDLDDENLQKKFNKVLHELQALQAAAAVPVIREGKMVAIFLIGNKVSGEPFSNEDVNLLEVLSSQLAAALERSKLYKEVQDFNLKLQGEVDKATKNLVKANDQLKEANVHLKELDTAKSEFMSIASHQLRTPLAGIVGYLSMILDGDYGKVDKEKKKIIYEVFAASQRLVRLVNTFLNVTRIEAGRFTLSYAEANFVDLVRAEVTELLPTAEKKNIKLEFIEPKESNISVAVDEKIKDAVLNLIDNAIKYTPEGKVIVGLDRKDKDKVHFYVKDSGVGIPQSDVDGLFQKFVRGSGIARVQPNGSGLGLYIVKKIVEGHNGRVWAESAGPDKGSTFNIEIPVKQAKANYRSKPETIFDTREYGK